MGNKIVGIILALVSGLFIGVSFVFKKKGLLQSTEKSGDPDGHAYLKNWTWWLGMTLMVIGEICNFVAYAFTEAILVTPLGALSVVVAAVGSSIFLKERLSFVGKIGSALCIVGATIIVLNSPAQPSVETIQEMQRYTISVVFLPYAGIVIAIAVFLAFWVGPKYGQKHMLVYISICSIIGGLSVVCTQGFGASVVSAIGGKPDQWNQWFLWVLLVFVVITLLTEINYLNKALNTFNTSVITSTYYTYFTTMTIISSAVLFRGFQGTVVQIITVVFGFLTIVAGVVLLQVSLAAADKSDVQQIKAELNDVSDVLSAPAEEDALNPGPAAIRGALSMRRLNTRNVSNASQVNTLHRRQTLNSSVSTTSSRYGSHHTPHALQGMHSSGYRANRTSQQVHDHHINTIRFVESEKPSQQARSKWSVDTSGTMDSYDQKSPGWLAPGISAATSRHSANTAYEDDISNVRLHDHDITTQPPRIPPTERPTSKGSVFKQFSFARGGRRTDEESLGLRSHSSRPATQAESSESESEGDGYRPV